MFSKSRINEPGPRAEAEKPKAPEAPLTKPSMDFTPSAPKGKAVTSILSSDLTVVGNLRTSGDIQVEGTVEGDIRAHLLTVGESATIRGETGAEDIVVNGNFPKFIALRIRQENAQIESIEANIAIQEQAIIDNLQHFLLELGKGFSFVARQQHIRFGDDDFYIDLVFYNYVLKCFLLLDLKMGKLTHADIGQMDGYVRLYEDRFKIPGDNPTIGLLLCSDKSEAVAKYSILNESKQIFASKYLPNLPTEEQLRREIERCIRSPLKPRVQLFAGQLPKFAALLIEDFGKP